MGVAGCGGCRQAGSGLTGVTKLLSAGSPKMVPLSLSSLWRGFSVFFHRLVFTHCFIDSLNYPILTLVGRHTVPQAVLYLY